MGSAKHPGNGSLSLHPPCGIMDFAKPPLDHSLFVYRNGDHFLALLIYVDDLVLTGSKFGNLAMPTASQQQIKRDGNRHKQGCQF